MSAHPRSWLALGGLLLAACPNITPPAPAKLASFQVTLTGLYLGTGATRVPLPVVSPCEKRYGGQDQVPADKKGGSDCRYAITSSQIEIDVTATALDAHGKPMQDFNGPISFRMVPGDLTGGYANRIGLAVNGVVNATIQTQHQYGSTQMWAEDAPPVPIFSDGGIVEGLPIEPAHRTFATGLSPVVFFQEPTLAAVQLPDGFDNRSSPLVGEFITIGKTPESGELLLQSCTDDPHRDGQKALMVVTGTDPGGFFVTDVSSCRLKEPTNAGSNGARVFEPKEPCVAPLPDGGSVQVELWDGGGPVPGPATCQISGVACTATTACSSYYPGTFGSMYIYNYSFPDGLDQGDLLWTINGAIQEFTSTTQMVFPSWSIAEKVRLLPPDQWNKWLQYVKPYEISTRLCGADNVIAPFLTDQLCGHNKRNLKMESLESTLVQLHNIRFPTDFTNCDFNADGTVPFFCENKDVDGNWFWDTCDFGSVEPDAEKIERVCTSDCVTASGKWAGKICSEKATYTGFGQFVIEMNPQGPASWGFDESLPARVQYFTVGTSAAGPGTPYGAGVEVNLGCDAEVRIAFGDGTVPATATDLPLAARTVFNHLFAGTETTVSVFLPGGGSTKCWVAQNAHGRMNLITANAVPDLQPDCRLDDPDQARADQCRFLRGATFDVVAHLRHTQPARPRWTLLPRDLDDMCCHPGPGLQCPRPIHPCP